MLYVDSQRDNRFAALLHSIGDRVTTSDNTPHPVHLTAHGTNLDVTIELTGGVYLTTTATLTRPARSTERVVALDGLRVAVATNCDIDALAELDEDDPGIPTRDWEHVLSLTPTALGVAKSICAENIAQAHQATRAAYDTTPELRPSDVEQIAELEALIGDTPDPAEALAQAELDAMHDALSAPVGLIPLKTRPGSFIPLVGALVFNGEMFHLGTSAEVEHNGRWLRLTYPHGALTVEARSGTWIWTNDGPVT